MAAPKEILDLVCRFDEHKEAYKSGQYNETQLRREFLDPFFKALGWDIDNAQGHAEQYKDVIHEDSIKIGGNTKAPDYCFRIGGARKFFLEAKKPSIFIKQEIPPAYQLRRYAWSAKLPLSILSDFEEFAIYDCRIRPQQEDKASTARVFYCTYDQYAEKWDEIAAIFSKEAVLKGSFDKYAETNKRKKGTTEVDAAFLSEIESWREHLAQNIALRNPELSQAALNYSVQQTIDRIIFLRICEDRGIEPYGQFQALQNGSNIYKRLSEIFHRADDRYNSGLFHFGEEKDRHEPPDRLTLGLHIDDKPLKEIFKHLYYPDSPYEFSVLGADILGSVYEQFLGKVIRLTPGHHAVVEDKPEVKKAGGVYYTPTYIVDYIVKHTVGKLVEGKTPKQVEKLRILDPACGSGSFLIGAYQYLMDWHLKWYEQNEPEKHARGRPPRVYRAAGNVWRLTTAERKRILLNNIYGVDIDAQAVEVTKLSLLLKVLEGESDQSLNTQMALFRERVLPDLGDNIKCGNSLIGPDFYETQLIPLGDDERRRINTFDWQKEFSEIMEAGGFDAVIGNPPYGADLSEEMTNYLVRKFKYQDYQRDTYLLFVEKSMGLLGELGIFGMIIPNTWLLNLQSEKIRRFIFSNAEVLQIRHYIKRVFTKVTVDTEVVVFRKMHPSDVHMTQISIVGKDNSVVTYPIPQNRWQAGEGKPVNIFERPELSGLADKLRALPILDNVCVITQGSKPFQVGKGNPPQTRKIVDEKPFVSESRKDSTFRPLLRGSLIGKYKNLWNNDYWISFGDWLAEPRYSAKHDAPEKVVIRQTGDSLMATLDRDQFVVRDNLYAIIPRSEVAVDLRYVLGVINSRLLNWYYQTVLNPEKGEALAQVKRGHLANLPIVTTSATSPLDKVRYNKIISLVESMLALYKQFAAAKTPHDQESIKRQIDATDRQIDKLVYELYGLTNEEIEIVEGAQ
jgi:predicted type IV restriction endonuclease